MKKVYNVRFLKSNGVPDETQLNAENTEELIELVDSLREEMDITEIILMEQVGQVRYYVCAIGYEANSNITDYEENFGDFDSYEDAYRCFVKTQCLSETELFAKVPRKIKSLLLQLEECEETPELIQCIDVINECTINR